MMFVGIACCSCHPFFVTEPNQARGHASVRVFDEPKARWLVLRAGFAPIMM